MSPPPLARAIRDAAAALERIRFAKFGSSRHGKTTVERFGGLTLYIPGSVLNPKLFRTGLLLGTAVADFATPIARVLDMGSGSGVVGILAARQGSRVISVDTNEDAVVATRVNAMMNRVRVDARHGHLFKPIDASERFDIIAFNPPYFERDHRGDPLARAFFDESGLPVLSAFCEELPSWLAPGGVALVAGSTRGALERMRAIYAKYGFSVRVVRRVERGSERIVIERLVPSACCISACLTEGREEPQRPAP